MPKRVKKSRPSNPATSSGWPATPSPAAVGTNPSKSVSVSHVCIAALGIFVLAMVLRLIHLRQIESIGFFNHPLSDGWVYAQRARGIAAGDWLGPADFVHAPLYAYLLGLIQIVAGHDWWTVHVVQIVMGSLACVMVMLACRKFFGWGTAVLAGALLALYPPAIFFDGLIQKTGLELFLATLLLWLLACCQEKPSRTRWLGAGLVLGLLALTRQNALMLVPLLFAWLWLDQRRAAWKLRLGSSTAAAVGLTAALLPWALRNLHVTGALVLTTPNLGQNFAMGNHPAATGTYLPFKRGRSTAEFEQQEWTKAAEAALGRRLSAVEVSDYYFDAALAYIRAHPAAWLRLMLKKWLMVWGAYECPDTEDYYLYQEWSPLLAALDHVLHFGVLCPLAAAGIVLTWSRRRELWVLYTWLLIMAAGVALFVVFARYRMGLIPVLSMFAAAGVMAAARRIRARQLGQLLPGAVGLTLVALLVNWPVHHPRRATALSYANHGAALAAQGRYAEDVAALNKALTLAPDDVDAHLAMGNTLVQLQRFEEALVHYERAHQGDPDYGGVYRGLGNALTGLARLAEAEEEYRRALAINLQDHIALNGLATAAARQQHYSQALELFEQVLRLDPTYVDALMNLGNTLLAMGRTDDAVAAYERGLSLDPDNADLLYNLGVAHSLSGRMEQAAGCFRKAIAVQPERRDFQAALDQVLGVLEQQAAH
ncbi:MAG: tetratricopeptide repeat protein [Planctomycetota bacterium]